jgi:predicted aspartyl protease
MKESGVKQNRSVFFAAIASLIASGAAAQPLIMLPSGHLSTQVQVNGAGPFTFVVDTAASASIVMPGLRQRLGLVPRGMPGHGEIHGASGNAPVQIFGLDKLVVDGRERSNVIAAGLDPLPGGGSSAEGIIGADTLSPYVAEFDVPGGQLRLHDAGTRLAAHGRWTELPAELNQARFPILRGTIDGQEVTILFDTGARRTLINWAAASLLGIAPGDAGLTASEPIRGATEHSTPAVQRDFKTIQVGDLTLDASAVTISDLAVFRSLGFEGKPAMILGIDKLRQFRFAVDYPRKLILVDVPAEAR